MDPQIDMARRLLVEADERLRRFIVSQAMASLGFAAGAGDPVVIFMSRLDDRIRAASIPP